MTRVAVTTLLLLCTLALPLPGWAEETSEHIDWGRWSFDYEVTDNTGLALRNVTFGGEQVLAKASMPVVRVGPTPMRISRGCSERAANSVMTKTIRAFKNRISYCGMWLTSRTWPPSVLRSGSPLVPP